jgi:hypothetical protein
MDTIKDCIAMPKYRCHKEVRALKIKAIKMDGEGEDRELDGSAIITPEDESYAPFKVSAGYMHKHDPRVGGYYVRYDDGYEELKQVEERISKLDPFTWNEKMKRMDEVDLALQRVQWHAMGTYLQCLSERLRRLKQK